MSIIFFISLYILLPYVSIFLIVLFLKVIVKKLFSSKQIIKVDETYYYRDIPCNYNIDLVHWLLYHYSNFKSNELNNGLVGAYLLKWYKNGYIGISYSGKKCFIDLKTGDFQKSNFENKLYDFLKNAAGNNNKLEKNEIERYCKVGLGDFEFRSIFSNLLDDVQMNLEKNRDILVVPEKNYIFFKIPAKISLSDKLIEEYKNIIGLRNFLSDFSNMEQKKYIQVHLWDEYLILANMFGIADKVKKQFKMVYPENNIVNNLFDLNLDETLIGRVNNIYKMAKFYLLVALFVVLMVVLLYVFNDSVYIKIGLALLFVVFLPLYYLLKKHIDSIRVKEMNCKTYAKIINVSSSTSVDYKDGQSVTTTYYSVDYEYNFNNVLYRGHDTFKKIVSPKQGNKIKIYYDLMNPNRSETAISRNGWLRMFVWILLIIIISLIFVFLNI